MTNPVLVALLLIASGGFMDAYTYIAYDHVFTNAQSGNVVVLAVNLAALDLPQALKHLPALLAFFPGVLIGRAISVRRTIAGARSDVAVLATQLACLSAVALFEAYLPAAAVTSVISVASAMQNTAFKKVDGASYTSVVTTGNLRSATEDLFTGLLRRDAVELRKAGLLGAVCVGFAVGAVAGAAATPAFGKAAIGLPMLLIAAALVLCAGQARQAAS